MIGAGTERWMSKLTHGKTITAWQSTQHVTAERCRSSSVPHGSGDYTSSPCNGYHPSMMKPFEVRCTMLVMDDSKDRIDQQLSDVQRYHLGCTHQPWKEPNDPHNSPASSKWMPNSFGESITRLFERRSLNTSKSQNTQCQSDAAHNKSLRGRCVTRQHLRWTRTQHCRSWCSEHFNPPTSPRARATKPCLTYIPRRHMGLNRGSVGSYLAASKVAIEPAQPATSPV